MAIFENYSLLQKKYIQKPNVHKKKQYYHFELGFFYSTKYSRT